MANTPGYEIRIARQNLMDEINIQIEAFEKATGSHVESINVSWKTEKSGGGGLDPDREVRTIEVNIII
jgi:hypothetical protein